MQERKFNLNFDSREYHPDRLLERLDIYGGRVVRNKTPVNPINTETSVEKDTDQKLTTEEQRLLAEIEMFLPYADNPETIPSEVEMYASFNEKTFILEAVTSGIISRTYRVWSPAEKDCIAFNQQTSPIFKKGLEDIKKTSEEESTVSFEVRRRSKELMDAEILNKALELGIMDRYDKVMISPFPEDTDEETAGNLGYFQNIRGAMIRIFSYNPETKVVTTTQLTLENSKSDAFRKVIKRLKGYGESLVYSPKESISSSTDILGTEIFIPKNSLEQGVVDVARMYDEVLEETFGNNFFLGKHEPNKKPEYGELYGKTEVVENDIESSVKNLLATDIEIAKALKTGTATLEVQKLIDKAITAIGEDGKDLLTSQQKVLLQNASEEKFNKQAAALLKKTELYKVWSLVSCLINPKKAIENFGEDKVYFVREIYRNNWDNPQLEQYLMSMIATSRPVYYGCGLKLDMTGDGANALASANLLEFSLSDIQQTLFGSAEGGAKYVKNCGNCGKSIEMKIRKGYKCSCKATYKGC